MLSISDYPFWREKALNQAEMDLLFHLGVAHECSATRGNISRAVLINVHTGSGQYLNALAAALLSLGGLHAPLAETMALLETDGAAEMAALQVDAGQKVPGWGNSFVKGGPDQLWRNVDVQLSEHFEELHERMCEVTQCLHDLGIKIFPNPSAYTAAAALAVGLPADLAAYLFVVGRLDGWSRQLKKGT